MDLLKNNQSTFNNKSTCPFCGKEVPFPYSYIESPFGTIEVFTVYKTWCINCSVEIEVSVDSDFHIAKAEVTPFEPGTRWFE